MSYHDQQGHDNSHESRNIDFNDNDNSTGKDVVENTPGSIANTSMNIVASNTSNTNNISSSVADNSQAAASPDAQQSNSTDYEAHSPSTLAGSPLLSYIPVVPATAAIHITLDGFDRVFHLREPGSYVPFISIDGLDDLDDSLQQTDHYPAFIVQVWHHDVPVWTNRQITTSITSSLAVQLDLSATDITGFVAQSQNDGVDIGSGHTDGVTTDLHD